MRYKLLDKGSDCALDWRAYINIIKHSYKYS